MALVLRFHPGVFRIPNTTGVAASPQKNPVELANNPTTVSRTLWPFPASAMQSVMSSATASPGVIMPGMFPMGWMGVAYVAHALFLDLMSTRLRTMCCDSSHLGEWVWCGWFCDGDELDVISLHVMKLVLNVSFGVIAHGIFSASAELVTKNY